jgi:hypothetical protein
MLGTMSVRMLHEKEEKTEAGKGHVVDQGHGGGDEERKRNQKRPGKQV